jgi:hypothetical protein
MPKAIKDERENKPEYGQDRKDGQNGESRFLHAAHLRRLITRSMPKPRTISVIAFRTAQMILSGSLSIGVHLHHLR